MAYVGPAQRRQGIYCHEHWTPVGYPLLNSRYSYLVRDVFVEATLVETYQAQTNVEREVSYIFEVPPEASVVDFTARVGDTYVKGIVEEKAEANKKYQAAKTAGIQAWKLEQINEEVFQISLGTVSPNSTIKISVTYVYMISSDTLEDSVRLSIPAGFEARDGQSPTDVTTVPTAPPPGTNAITVTVSIETNSHDMILDLNCVSHHADITGGFSDDSFKSLSPVKKAEKFSRWKSFVEFSSETFLKHDFVLVWTVPRVDQARCVAQKFPSPIQGQPHTCAFALTLVSNVILDPEEHEYIFLIDCSHSMAGARLKMANEVVKNMLYQLPTRYRSSFNIYNFSRRIWSIIPGGKSLGLDTTNVSTAVQNFASTTDNGTDINNALITALSQRDQSRPRCSIIVITDGMDWGVTQAMKTVEKQTTDAAAQSKLLRVFVMGIGDSVSRGMCEGLARVGSGATSYISQSSLQDHDHAKYKSMTLINAINRAPIRVSAIDWKIRPRTNAGAAQGTWSTSRPSPKQEELGPAAKGDNIPAPPAIQQAPLPGTMFWAVRSHWFAITQGEFEDLEVDIRYNIPGSHKSSNPHKVRIAFIKEDGRLIHALAAHALIQSLEQKLLNCENTTDRYWLEAQIVHLGKAYSLASSQTSFVATMNEMTSATGVATYSKDQSLLHGVPTSNPSLDFVKIQGSVESAYTSSISTSSAISLATISRAMPQAAAFASHAAPAALPHSFDSAGMGNSGEKNLSSVIGAQNANGGFDAGTIERIIFSGTGIPATPAFISSCAGHESVKTEIWQAVCVMAYFRQRCAGRESEWTSTYDKASHFVKTTLCCVFGVDIGKSEQILASSLNDAEAYFL